MNALEALHGRTSCPRLVAPSPSREQLENIFKAAIRTADHGLLRPWRFLCIRGESLNRLGDLFVKASVESDPSISEAKLASIRNKPGRAPLIIITIAQLQEHPKIPAIEMELSAAGATQNMLLAAHAQGFGGMWRTGSMAYNRTVKNGLGLTDSETIVGFLYIGTRAVPPRNLPDISLSDYVTDW